MNVYYNDLAWDLVRMHSEPPLRKVSHYVLARTNEKGERVECTVRTSMVTFVNNRGDK